MVVNLICDRCTSILFILGVSDYISHTWMVVRSPTCYFDHVCPLSSDVRGSCQSSVGTVNRLVFAMNELWSSVFGVLVRVSVIVCVCLCVCVCVCLSV